MEKSYSASYAAAGVDITAGYRSVELMKQYVARTMTENCIGGLGGFGGLFELDCTGYKHLFCYAAEETGGSACFRDFKYYDVDEIS